MEEKVYHVGVLGCANIALRSLLPAFHQSNNFKLCAIGSRSIEKSTLVAQKYGCKAYGSYEAVLFDSEVEVVYIPLPTGMHYKWIKKALLAGKHIISEKSLASNLNEVEELTHIAMEKNLLLFENFQFRFHGQNSWVRNFIAEGNIGEIRCIRSSFGFPPFTDANNIRYSAELGGGALLDAAAYTLKSLGVILPKSFFTVKAALVYKPQDSDVDLWGGAFLTSKEGITAELAWGFDNYYQCNYEIWGSKGKLMALRAYTAPETLQPIVVFEKQGVRQEISLPAENHFLNMMSYVASLISKREFEQEYQQNILQARYLEQIRKLSFDNNE